MSDNSSQEIRLKNRKDLTITGVKKMNSLDPKEILIDTTLGKMKILGEDLEMLSLDIENGELIVTGTISAISYSDGKTKKDNSSFIAKLFK